MRGHKTTCHLQSGFLLEAVHRLLPLLLLLARAQVHLYYHELIFPSPCGNIGTAYINHYQLQTHWV